MWQAPDAKASVLFRARKPRRFQVAPALHFSLLSPRYSDLSPWNSPMFKD
jgi:hypothetical protein